MRLRPESRPTPLAALGLGLAAGVLGTAAMTLHQELRGRLRRDSEGQQEQQRDAWESAPAPAVLAKRVIEGVFETEVAASRIPLVTNVMHWLYGTLWGGVYGLIEGTIDAPPARIGPAFGAGVWAMSYVQLVPLGLYEPPWRYPPAEIANDLGYHLTYGVTVAAGYRMLERAAA